MLGDGDDSTQMRIEESRSGACIDGLSESDSTPSLGRSQLLLALRILLLVFFSFSLFVYPFVRFVRLRFGTAEFARLQSLYSGLKMYEIDAFNS